jgi:hypothetical protein
MWTDREGNFVMRSLASRRDDCNPATAQQRQAEIDQQKAQFFASGGQIEALDFGLRRDVHVEKIRETAKQREMPKTIRFGGDEYISTRGAAGILSCATTSLPKMAKDQRIKPPRVYQNRNWWHLESVREYAKVRAAR